MFVQKFKASLRFLGVLFLRLLLGIVVGYVWLFVVAFVFHQTTGAHPVSWGHRSMDIFEIFDFFYDSTREPPRELRYGEAGRAAHGIALQVGLIGFWVWAALGVLWGVLQGRLGLQRWLRK